jgi:hypothetical protein
MFTGNFPMLRLYHLKMTPTIAIFLLLWGCSGGGGAGGGDQRVKSTSIKLPASGSFRQLNTSDLFIYDAEVEVEEYDWRGSRISQTSFSTTIDADYYKTNYGDSFVGNRFEQLYVWAFSFGNGLRAEMTIAEDPNGDRFIVRDSEGNFLAGEVENGELFPLPLTPGDAVASAGTTETFTELGYADPYGSYLSLVGVYQYRVSQPKKFASALGRVEVVEVTITSELTDEYGDFSNTTFSLLVNPAIGIIKYEESSSFSEYGIRYDTSLVAEIREVNFSLPAATSD